MTPLDLFALTGIVTEGRAIETSPGIRFTKDGVKADLGWRFDRIAIPHTVLLDRLSTKGA